MEKFIHNAMMNHLALNKLIASEQHGFVNDKNYCSNLLETLDFITSKIETGNIIDILFLDFAKTFDSVSLSKLCCTLYGYDDTKIMSVINNESNNNALQEDLNKLLDWSNKWSIKFNREKCKIMQIGNSNPQFSYKLGDHILQKTEIEKDLGVII
ncbi:uncharacterized protein LOC136089733 [Hydra vulgaris]|uniref:Uncharacterized protein LOC136089733 n=1 Tax=Hydra vulgaris TaxID=6087 RepID=A0ABM4DBW9_HYDVU